MDPSPQQRYRLIQKLGEGAMGEVFLAENLLLRRREALKVLHPSLAGDAEFVERFRREARATNRVHHPNVVALYDFGRLDDGRFFLALEHVEGERIDDLLRRAGPMTLAQAMMILCQLADAAAAAHTEQVVHRDLKPANLMLTSHRGRSGWLKVLDFGLAKIVAPGYQEKIATTRRGDVMGTPSYLAPDLLLGGPANPRCDVYSIGCIAVELLTGSPPFVGTPPEVTWAHLEKAPPVPSQLRPNEGIPPALDELVLRCLSKRAADRFADGVELRRALDAVRPIAPAGPSVGWRGGQEAFAPTVEAEGRQGWELARSGIEAAARGLAAAGRGVVAALDELRWAEDRLAIVRRKIRENEARTLAAEQAVRDGQTPLRFAMGELSFELSQAAPELRTELDTQLATLAGRLQAVTAAGDVELDSLTERGIELALSCDDAEAAMRAAAANLGRAIDAVLAAPPSGSESASDVSRLRKSRHLVKLVAARPGGAGPDDRR